ncbi:MAG: hypothetical protein C4B59_06475 [Candidatus Methanogaster sp.]|uniref:Uncharacterized protein n=1 Tax=Candidatus Methanogaster sp. TaxID=3386292 RepID=A0AC61L402_9EURY|nr:MAG: hypothetical protein C4B59_06475 [ANME-2 cluster archaeon]
MDTQSMLKQMCKSDITDSDIKAICKSRGFSAKEATSRDVFENFFISTIGIKEVLDSLTYKEVVFLHLLDKIKEEVGIEYFERLYGCAESTKGYYYMTFTKRYKETFKKVKSNLVRKGVLIAIERETYGKSTKMERLQFYFPPEFGSFLPPLVKASKFKKTGKFKREVLRDKLLELAGGERKRPSPLSKSDRRSFKLTINEGNLSIGREQFRAKYLLDWQKACMRASIKTDTEDRGYPGYPSDDMAPVDAALYAIAQLGEHEWLPADGLEVILKIFTGDDVNHPCEQICEAGWEWGCLVKVVVDMTAYYRLPDDSLDDAAAPTPDQYLQIAPDGTVVLDLVKIPYTALEVIASIALMDIHNANLRATADIIKIGDALTTVRKEGIFEWLRENSSGFRSAIEIAEKRWGKQIIHEDLMVAQVKDLSLKVQIEKSCNGSQLVSLPDDYIAFPCGVLPAIQKIVSASGHVVKKARNE